MGFAIIVVLEVIAVAVACWGILHEDRLIALERRIAAFWRKKRVQRAARVVEAAGYACWPKRRR